MKTSDIAVIVLGIGLSSLALQSHVNSTKEKAPRESYIAEEREAVIPSRLEKEYLAVYNRKR